MKQARPAPIFKPLSSTENTSLFNFESQANHASRPMRPFMNMNEQSRQSQQQQQESGTERLSSLHAKLHQEADKIRKWKVQTEIELKQKEKKIHEASTTNESLRKSILELQLQNENLSLKLQEEMGNREDVVQRISSTRQLCNILKDHAVKLEEQLHHCETERTELKYLEREHLQQFEELSEEFNKLRITSVEKHNTLVSQLHEEREDRQKLEKELEAKLGEAELQLKALVDQCDEKDIEIRDVRTMLQRNDEKIHTLEQSIASLQEQREQHVADIQTKDTNLEAASEKLFLAEKEKICYEEKLSEISSELASLKVEKKTVEENMESSRLQYDEQLATLKQHNLDLDTSLQAQTDKVKQYEVQLSEASMLSENLKSCRDILTLEKTELEGKIALLSKELGDNKKATEEYWEAYSSLKAERETLETNFNTSKEETEQLKSMVEIEKQRYVQCDREYQALCDRLHSVEETLKEKEEMLETSERRVEDLQSELQLLKAELSEVQMNLDQESDQLKASKSMISDLHKESESKTKLVSNMENKMKKDNEKSQKEIRNLKEENQALKTNLEQTEEEKQELFEKTKELEEQIEHLKEEQNEQDKTVDSTMKTKSKQISDLETKVKDLKGDITSKNKQIKEHEKEIKGLKSKMTAQTKASDSKDKEIGELQERLEGVTGEKKKLVSDIEWLTQQVNQLTDSERSAQEKMDEMRVSRERSEREKQESEKKCEYELAEMVAMMEKYKQENNKIVTQKEREIEALKSRSVEFTSQKQKRDGDFAEMKKVSEEMKASLDTAVAEKNELETKLSSHTHLVENLEKTIASKDAEIKDLKENAKQLKKQVKTKTKVSTSQTQTTPASSPAKVSMTPKLHKTTDSSCESSSYSSPQNQLKTPQRSILRNTNSVSKRRKVAFASHDDSGRHSASDSDSSSELMEVEMDSVDARYKNTNIKSTPLLIRPSPKVKPSPKPVTPNRRTETSEKTPMQITRIPRGPPVKLADRKQKSQPGCVVKEEREMYRALFPSKQEELASGKENRVKNKEEDTSHLRKTPSKSTAKFFKASPKDRLSKKAKHTEETAWFDLDSVFGFGPED